MLQIPQTNLLLLAAKQEPYEKASLLTKNTKEFSGKIQENGPAGRKKEEEKTERVTGLGRRTREEIVKWNQMTVSSFQTRGMGGGREGADIPASFRGESGC